MSMDIGSSVVVGVIFLILDHCCWFLVLVDSCLLNAHNDSPLCHDKTCKISSRLELKDHLITIYIGLMLYADISKWEILTDSSSASRLSVWPHSFQANLKSRSCRTSLVLVSSAPLNSSSVTLGMFVFLSPLRWFMKPGLWTYFSYPELWFCFAHSKFKNLLWSLGSKIRQSLLCTLVALSTHAIVGVSGCFRLWKSFNMSLKYL